MHSVDNQGNICINLNDYNEVSDSIKFREKIDYLVERCECPRDISHFSIAMFFRNGQCYYLSNLYLWAIPYRTEGFYRGDIDHDPLFYCDKEYFIQNHFNYDDMQIPIIQVMESRYNLSTTFALVRKCAECDLIIEAYNKEKIANPDELYFQIRNDFERFICEFLDAMQAEILTALPRQRWLTILNDSKYRNDVIMRKMNPVSFTPLSLRELQCLELIAKGFNAKQIAQTLSLSAETITTHAKSIRQKLRASNITEAVTKAIRWGLM